MSAGRPDVADLANIAPDEVAEVGLEEPRAPPEVCPAHRLGVATGQGPPQVVGPAQLRGPRRKISAVLEDGVDESLTRPVELALRQGPELDRLGSTRQQVRDLVQGKEARGSGEQELPRAGVQVDPVFDCEHEVRDTLHLVEDQQAVVTDERGGIRVGCRPNRGVVEIPDLGTALTVGDEASQRALPRLPSPVEDNHPGVRQRREHVVVGAARIEVPCRRHLTKLARQEVAVADPPKMRWLSCRYCGGCSAGRWMVTSPTSDRDRAAEARLPARPGVDAPSACGD